MHCVDFVENALFRSSGDIAQLTMDIGDSDGFFSRILVCRSSDSSYNLTESSLITADYRGVSRI